MVQSSGDDDQETWTKSAMIILAMVTESRESEKNDLRRARNIFGPATEISSRYQGVQMTVRHAIYTKSSQYLISSITTPEYGQ